MNASPRTTREALLAEMLGDLDNMLTRIENLPQLLESCETRLSAKADALDASGEKYGQAVAAYTEQAKEELADFLERESVSSVEQLTVTIRQITQEISLSEMERAKLGFPKNFLQLLFIRLFEHGVTALIASLFTVFLIRFSFY